MEIDFCEISMSNRMEDSVSRLVAGMSNPVFMKKLSKNPEWVRLNEQKDSIGTKLMTMLMDEYQRHEEENVPLNEDMQKVTDSTREAMSKIVIGLAENVDTVIVQKYRSALNTD